MKNLLMIITLTFAFPVFKLSAQREYAYCRHAYCHAMHVYEVPYTYFTPTLLTLVLNETDANPYNKLTCPTTNNIAIKHFKTGLGNIHQYNYLSRRGEDKPKQEFHLNMATVYFAGAIKSDSAFCDAYDNLVNCFYLRKMYDSAIRVVDNQRNPSFHSNLAKGVIYYEIKNDFLAAEQYFEKLSQKSPTAIFYYYQAQSQIKLNKLNEAKTSIAKMDTTLKLWHDGWAMVEKTMLLNGVIACKEKEYDLAYKLLDRIKKEFKNDPVFCHYYAVALLSKTSPSKSKGSKFIKRSVELKYNPVSMI